ncbi:MAG: hypothetical protein ACI31M_00740 [Bacilli bacterium]
MKTLTDIVVNFDDIMYYFYEWEDNDKVEYVKEIPLIKVSKKVFKTILLNHISLNTDFMDKIKSKTLISESYINALVITDSVHAFVLEFDNNGSDIAISTLGVSDELDVCEKAFKMKNENIIFQTLGEREFNSVGRKDKYISNFIRLELEELNHSKDKSKISYFYKELFHKECNDFDTAIKEMQNSITTIRKEHYYLYELMLLSHKKSGLSN